LTALFLQSCGIEAYYYLTPVSAGNIVSSVNQQATIALPGVSASYFTNFAMYYRIYVSYSNRTGFSTSARDLQDINPTLYSDYNYLSAYTNATNSTTANIASVMANRGYHLLHFEESGGNVSSDILTSPGVQLQIAFPPQPSATYPYPYLSYQGGRIAMLKRSNGNGAFSPLPEDRYFVNRPALNEAANITSTVNADVVNAGSSSAGQRNTYVSVYIVTAGLNEQTYTQIFSIPTFVGIFMLPTYQ
jgi:hypothetical protein